MCVFLTNSYSLFIINGVYILQCLLHCQLVYAKNCTVTEFKSTKSGLCCKLCPAGEYMTKECTQDAETLCQACPAQYFTSNSNSLPSCQKCSSSTCDGGRILKQSCTRTADNQCECPADQYFNTHTLHCKDCTVCSRGEKVISPCQTYQDASCEACPKVGKIFFFFKLITINITLCCSV